MNERIENCLSKELAHIFTVMPGVTWPKKCEDYDEKVRQVRLDLRGGGGQKYLDILNTLLKDDNTDYHDFHKFYVSGIQELLRASVKRGILNGPINTVAKVDHSGEDANVFEQCPDVLDRLTWANYTVVPYYYYLKYGIERLNQDIKQYYDKAIVYIERDYFTPDFMRDQYLLNSHKYMIFWPLMPSVIVYNGYPGVYNKGPNGDQTRI